MSLGSLTSSTLGGVTSGKGVVTLLYGQKAPGMMRTWQASVFAQMWFSDPIVYQVLETKLIKASRMSPGAKSS